MHDINAWKSASAETLTRFLAAVMDTVNPYEVKILLTLFQMTTVTPPYVWYGSKKKLRKMIWMEGWKFSFAMNSLLRKGWIEIRRPVDSGPAAFYFSVLEIQDLKSYRPPVRVVDDDDDF